jgi:uncharacterized protein (TIRG00374 family)
MINLKTLSDFIRSRHQGILVIIALITSAVIISALLYFSDVNLIFSTIGTFDPKWYPVIFLLFLLLLIIVALRLFLSLRLSGINNYVLALDASLLHIVLLNILPARLGDLCYPFLLKSNLKIITARSIANLITIRIYDFVSVVILLILSSWIYFFRTTEPLDFQVYLLAGIPAIILLVYFFRKLVSLTIKHLPPNRYYVFKKDLHKFISELDDGFTVLGFIDHVLLLITTILRWFVTSLLFFSIFKGTGIHIDFNSAILITTGINLSVVIPLQTIGGFGVAETVLAYFLGLFGHPVGIAIAIAISTRIIWLFPLLCTGGVWLLFRKSILKLLKDTDSVEPTIIQ